MADQAYTDRMTPLERLTAYGRGEPVDRLPCIPVVGNTAARVIGCRVSAFRRSGRLIADAQIAAYRRFRYDGIRVFTDLYQVAEAMGSRVHYPEDETAYLQEPAISRLEQIGCLRPADPYKDGNLPHHLEAMARVVDAVGHEVPVTGAIPGPFTNASFLIGTENLVRMAVKQPDAVHALCKLSLETALAYAEAIFDQGCSPSLTDPMSSSAVIGPRHFREFSLPYLQAIVDYVHGRNKPITLHICGNTTPILELMTETGADCLSLDEQVDLGEAKCRVGHRVRIMGNVHPSAIMFLGTQEEVRSATRRCLAQAWDAPKGFIAASGCSLPTDTPFPNIQAMMDAVREVGYPVAPEILLPT